MTPSCLFNSTDGLVALQRPDLTLTANNKAELMRCVTDTQEALADGFLLAAGILPYEAGAWLREVSATSAVTESGRSTPSVVPAVIHLYRELPTAVSGSEAVLKGQFSLCGAFQEEQRREQYLHLSLIHI